MRKWTESEVEFLRQNYPQKTYKELAKCLARTVKSVERKLIDCGLAGKAKSLLNANRQSISKVGSRRRASNRYNGVLSRLRQTWRSKNAHYAQIKLLVSRREFIEWYMPRDFEGASVDRIDKTKDYELSNMQVIPLAENIRKDKIKAKDGFCQCSRCQQIKPIRDFAVDKRISTGISTICKKCDSERKKKSG